MNILLALIRKEALQIIRDPSSIQIALVLPLILLFLFGYGVNLDSNKVHVGLVVETNGQDALSLAAAFTNSRFFEVRRAHDRRELEHAVTTGKLRGIIVIPQNVTAPADTDSAPAHVQVITDGSEPNTASFVQNYTRGLVQTWLMRQAHEKNSETPPAAIEVNSRFWYNPELKSRNFLLPGSIVIIMTLIGALLTAMVIAREWEHGTMESMLATPVSVTQILLGKLIPYFILAVSSMIVCFTVATLWYDVPFRGSFIALFITTSCFLITALGLGLLISTLAKNQFLAAQFAMITAFLPAFMLSGFIFEIASMPAPIRAITYIFAARYFVACLQTLFLAGNIWPLLCQSIGCMLLIGSVFFILTASKTSRRLD
jgi:ABC-2 type transport system permease protein